MLLIRMRWLALDVGKRRVGVAICDARESLATALPSFPWTALLENVAAIINEYGIEGIVIGVPATVRGASRGEARVEEAVARLAVLGVPVECEDERGTTAAAQTLLRAAGVPRRKWRGRVDSLAAQLILESFLDRRRRRGLPAPQ